MTPLQFAPMYLKRPKRKETSLVVRQMTLIAISLLRPIITYLSLTDLSLLNGHTFLPLSLNVIEQHDFNSWAMSSKWSKWFEEDGNGRPICIKKQYLCFSTGNMKVTRKWLNVVAHWLSR